MNRGNYGYTNPVPANKPLRKFKGQDSRNDIEIHLFNEGNGKIFVMAWRNEK